MGITHACAGNSHPPLASKRADRDHPRVCGEQARTAQVTVYLLGSPPRVRGTVVPRLHRIEAARITPACAGNRRKGKLSLLTQRDHPRVCGEQSFCSFVKTRKPGSPPRVRGTGTKVSITGVEGGITPACAGNSLSNKNLPSRRADHPRVCGEQKWSL